MSDELAHVGVKGMKWGVRKDRRSGTTRGSSRPPAKKPAGKKPSAAKVSEAKSAPQTSRGKKVAKTALKAAGYLAVASLSSTATVIGGFAALAAHIDSGVDQYNGYSPREHETGIYPTGRR